MKIYIAGPMTGLPDFNYPAFNTAAAALRDAGHQVENPAENPDPACKSWAGYMRMALAQLVTCEAIFLLKGWENSKGARIEHDIARELGIALHFEPGAEKCCAYNPRMWQSLARIANGNVMSGRENFSYIDVIIEYQKIAAQAIERSSGVCIGIDFAKGVAPAAVGPQLSKPARVGGGTFHTGVPERLVIEAAQRHYEREKERESLSHEQMIDQERKRRALWDMVHGPLDLAAAAPVVDPVQAAADAASVGHLANLLDHQSALLARAMGAMKALELTASAINESQGDLDARIPCEAWATFVDARAALLYDVAQSPVADTADPADALSQAARDVLAERQRQISVEGWTPERDDRYPTGDLASAAACYAMQGRFHYPAPGKPGPNWPWAPEWWKPSTYRRNLEKSGALIIAEIERLDRAAIAAQAAQTKGDA